MAVAHLLASPPPSRPGLLRALARASAPILRGEETRACLAGPPRSGKSTLLREFLPELHRAAAERGLRLPVYLVDGRSAGTAYGLLAALVRLAGGEAPATGWSWERLVEAWRSRVPGPAVVAVDHADEAAGAERLLSTLSRGAPLGLLLTARSGSALARKQEGAISTSPVGLPPPPPVPVEAGPAAPQGPGALPTAASNGPPASGAVARNSHPSPSLFASYLREQGEGGPEGVPEAGPEAGMDRRDDTSSELLRRLRVLGDAPGLLLALLAREEGPVTTGRLWRAYLRAASGTGLRPLTLRRVSGLLRELEDSGLALAPVLSHGRRGRTKWAVLTSEARDALQELGI